LEVMGNWGRKGWGGAGGQLPTSVEKGAEEEEVLRLFGAECFIIVGVSGEGQFDKVEDT